MFTAILLLAIGSGLPQADREQLVLRRAQIQQEHRLRYNNPGAYQNFQTPSPQINIYAPVYAPNFSYPIPGIYGYGRPAWPPQW